MDRHAPLLRPKPSIISTSKWYTAEIDKAAIDRDIAKANKKRDPTPRNCRLYNELRNRVNEMIQVDKDGHLRPRLNVNLRMKKLWKNVRDLGLVASSSSSAGTAFTADEFNRHTVGNGSQC